MTIYILDEDLDKAVQFLDDKSLDCQIKEIAQVLCNVHHIIIDNKLKEASEYSENCNNVRVRYHLEIPLKCEISNQSNKWLEWTRECQANYLWMVRYGSKLLLESILRYPIAKSRKKYKNIISWAIDNVPNLPPVKHVNFGDGFYITAILRKNNWCYLERKNEDGSVEWALDYLNNLITEFPLTMPNKYQQKVDHPQPFYICYFRNYYDSKLISSIKNKHPCDKIKIKWTNRERPTWLNWKE